MAFTTLYCMLATIFPSNDLRLDRFASTDTVDTTFDHESLMPSYRYISVERGEGKKVLSCGETELWCVDALALCWLMCEELRWREATKDRRIFEWTRHAGLDLPMTYGRELVPGV